MSTFDDYMIEQAVAKDREIRRYHQALREIASQKLPAELEDPDAGDYESAYSVIVGIARKALENPHDH